MRVLKSGEVKYKASAYKSAERMARPPFPMPIYRKGDKVKVFLGAGFGTGYVESSHQDRCVVRLTTGNRAITVYDARSIEAA